MARAKPNPNHLQNTMTATTSTPAEAVFDLDTIEDLDTADIELLNPKTQQGTGAFITLAGPEHPERKAQTFKLIRKARADMARNAAAKRGAVRQPDDPEDDMRETIAMLASITMGWRGIAQGGKPIAFTRQAAIDLYSDPKRQWIVRQLVADMNAVDVFTKA